ncbi:glyoxalase [Tumebacillus avium]|uniref:Glyoxalase n=1 Tax=Tumebacillus avium TaxID=1903704 RepID=A0A1Y0IPT5_9BACL|nr:VOC family protein [Tumebacillus avium]ARU61836.1 glyoxalase [Tumebacillus avium]
MAIRKIEHVGIMVRDLEASIKFYTEVIGMELHGRLQHTNGVIQLAFLGFQGAKQTELELIQGYNSDLPREGKVHHLALNVDNLEEEIGRLEQHGVKWIDQEITTLPNGTRYKFFEGPDGEWLELFEVTK